MPPTWNTHSGVYLITINGNPRPPQPKVTMIEVTSSAGIDDTYGIGDEIEVTVTFNEDITVDTSSGTPELALDVGGTAKGAECAADGTALDTLVCTYEVAENDADTDGISIGANSLTLEGGAITYRGGTTPARLTHAAVPSNPEHKVNGDPTVPTITNIVFTSSPSFSSDTYGEDEMVEFSLIFSHVVWITGTPLAQMNVGGDYPRIPLYAGSGTNTLRFRYTVLSGDSDNDGVSIVLHTLAPGGTISGVIDADPAGSATIQTSAGVNATIRNQPTGTQAGHKVDGSMQSSMLVPNAPTNVTATPDGADAIHIAWTTPTFGGSSAITFYWMDRSRTGSAPWTSIGISPTSPFSNTGLDAATTYHYRVTAANDSGDGTPSDSASATTAADLVCGRTSAIADAITAAARVASCKKVTAAQLGEITSLDASDKSMTSLANGDLSGLSSLTMLDLSDNLMSSVGAGTFSGLGSLTRLDLSGNDFSTIASGLFSPLEALEELDLSRDTVGRVPAGRLSGIFTGLPLTSLKLASNTFRVLPDGILTGLSNLATLDLSGNTVDPLPVIVTLERVARAEFKAAIPAGAPFTAAVPVTVTGGTLVGTPATVTVAAGARDSGTRTVTPASTRTGAVEVTVGALPAIPSGHSGYVLEASADLPLTVVSAPATVTIEAETGQVLANAWDYANFTLTRSPVSGSIDVDVAITESDTVLSGGPKTVTATFNDGEATAMVPRLLLIGTPSGDAIITATVQDGTDHTAGDPGTATLDVKHIDPAMDVTIAEETVEVEEGQPAVVHIVATASEGVDQPGADKPIVVNVSTRKASADPNTGDYTTVKGHPAEISFERSDFSQNADGRWVARKPQTAQTHDDDEYEVDETFGFLLERSASLWGTITINAAGGGTDTATVTLTDNEPPPPPTNIATSRESSTEINLRWLDPEIADDDEITGYKLEWSLTGGDPWEIATNVEDYNSPFYHRAVRHHGLTPKTTYFYRLSTINAHGTGAPSALESTTTYDDVVCARTPQVRDWIVENLLTASTCGDVIEADLALIAGEMDLSSQEITELQPGDFDGLKYVTRVDLDANELATLPDGLFDEMIRLRQLYLNENELSSLPPNIFRNIQSLWILYLNDNELEGLPDGMLAGRDLYQLSASNNPFSTLGSRTFAGASIDFIDLSPGNLTSLPADIFAPLRNSLTALYVDNNDLADLPDGLLAGLTLGELSLGGNPGAPFQIEVTLESDGGNEVRVSVPIGAPTNFDVPLTATNGIVDGTSTKTISVDRGAVASAPIIVERNAGSTAPVSATLGAISATMRDDHNGYAFALSTQTTFEIMAEASVVSAPTDLTAQRDGPNEIVLAWTAPEDDVTAPIAGYRIEVSTDGETWTDAVTNTASTDTTYMHARRIAGTTYYYRVRAVNAAGSGAASNEASAMTTALTGVCARTPAVVIEIEQATATDCSLVSANQLAAITEIDLATHAPTALLPGDFGGMSGLTTLDLGSGLSALPPDLLAGLTSLTSITASGGSIATLPSSLFAGRHTLTTIDLNDNPISSLPDGIFAGLAQLGTLDVTPTGDGVTLPLTVELRKVDDGKLRAVVPAGAPFDMMLPITVTNGALGQGETSVTVAAGTFESTTAAVTRDPASHEAVTVNLGTFPTLPVDHQGYALTASDPLPLEMLPGEGASIIALSVTTTHGPFGPDDELGVDVIFDKNVTVDTMGGNPYVGVDVGGQTKQAGYVSGTETNQLRFQYTIQSGDNDTNGISIAANALKTDNGTIRSGDFDADLAHDAVPAIPTATVDSIAPTLLAATIDAALITLTYDETVRRAGNQGWPFEYKIGTGDFSTVCGYHIDGRTVKQTLCAAVNAEDAIELRYEFTPPAAHLEDTAGNDAPAFTQALDNVTSATAPTITGIEITSDPNDDMRMGDDETYAIGDTVEVTVTFDGSVTVNTAAGTPELELDIGASAVPALYSSGSGSSELVFTYTVAEDDEDTDGIAIGANKLSANGAIIASNGKTADLAHIAEPASGHNVDGIRPTMTSSESSTAGAQIGVVFNETIASTLTGYDVVGWNETHTLHRDWGDRAGHRGQHCRVGSVSIHRVWRNARYQDQRQRGHRQRRQPERRARSRHHRRGDRACGVPDRRGDHVRPRPGRHLHDERRRAVHGEVQQSGDSGCERRLADAQILDRRHREHRRPRGRVQRRLAGNGARVRVHRACHGRIDQPRDREPARPDRRERGHHHPKRKRGAARTARGARRRHPPGELRPAHLPERRHRDRRHEHRAHLRPGPQGHDGTERPLHRQRRRRSRLPERHDRSRVRDDGHPLAHRHPHRREQGDGALYRSDGGRRRLGDPGPARQRRRVVHRRHGDQHRRGRHPGRADGPHGDHDPHPRRDARLDGAERHREQRNFGLPNRGLDRQRGELGGRGVRYRVDRHQLQARGTDPQHPLRLPGERDQCGRGGNGVDEHQHHDCGGDNHLVDRDHVGSGRRWRNKLPPTTITTKGQAWEGSSNGRHRSHSDVQRSRRCPDTDDKQSNRTRNCWTNETRRVLKRERHNSAGVQVHVEPGLEDRDGVSFAANPLRGGGIVTKEKAPASKQTFPMRSSPTTTDTRWTASSQQSCDAEESADQQTFSTRVSANR